MSRSRADVVAATYVAPTLRRLLHLLARAEIAFYDALEAFSGYDEVAATTDRLQVETSGVIPKSAA